MSAYEKSDGTIEYSWKEILFKYLKGLLIPDIVACFPFQIMDLIGASTGTGSYKNLLKLARLPRLVRVLRILKFIELMKKNKIMQNMIRKISMNPGIMRLINTLIIVSVLVHVYSCLWFLQSKVQNHNPKTWVMRTDSIDLEPSIQYLTAVYWSCQLLTTVGYGDFGVGNTTELWMSIIMMIFGVAVYSFVLGNIQSIIIKKDEDTEDLVNKLKALETFKKRNKSLKESDYKRIKKSLEHNYNTSKWKMEFDKYLPASLNDKILEHVYGDTVKKIKFFNEIPKKDFVWAVLPILVTIKFGLHDIVYIEKDLANEVYFIKTGSIKMSYKKQKIGSVVEGDYFGDIEVLLNLNREFTAKADTEVELLVANKKKLEKILNRFPDVKSEMLNNANEKRKNYYDIIIQKQLPLPDKTLDVYGVPNLISDETRKTNADMPEEFKKVITDSDQ